LSNTGVSSIRRFSNSADPNREAERLADQAKASQHMWDFLVPEKNMGVTHPMFLVLLALTLGLNYYNRQRDGEENEALRKQRLASYKPE
jgi:hypothetical protein